MAYIEAGRGAPLILVHGWPFNKDTFAPLMRELQGAHRCLAFDLLGVGDSHPRGSGRGFSVQDQAAALLEAIADIGVRDFALAGQDTGGVVARLAAATAGPRARGLVLINTEIPRHRPPWVPFHQRVSRLPFSGGAFRAMLRMRAVLRSPMGFGNCFCDKSLIFGEFHRQVIRPIIEDRAYLEGHVRFLESLDWALVDGLSEVHARIDAPVHLIWGEEDPFFPVELARSMLSQFRNPGAFIVVPGTKLLPYYEKPGLVAEHIKEVLGPGWASTESAREATQPTSGNA